MTENKRFNDSNTHGWAVYEFLQVMNALDDKNKALKERIEELESENKKLKLTMEVYTSKEINEKMNKYFLQYVDIFKADKMSFADFTLVKSVITDLQVLFDSDGDVE